MKKLIIIVVVLVVVAGVAFGQRARFTNGNFTATGVSFNAGNNNATPGSLTAAVTFRGNRITQIQVSNATDSPAFLNMVSNQLIPAIIQAQNTNVSAVSGATYTSRGVMQAVDAAMAQARR